MRKLLIALSMTAMFLFAPIRGTAECVCTCWKEKGGCMAECPWPCDGPYSCAACMVGCCRAV